MYSYVYQHSYGSVSPVHTGAGGGGTVAEVASRQGAEARSCPPLKLRELLPPAWPATEETQGVWAKSTNQAKARCARNMIGAPGAAVQHQLWATHHLTIKYNCTGATCLQIKTRNRHGRPSPVSGWPRVWRRKGPSRPSCGASATAATRGSLLPLLGAG